MSSSQNANSITSLAEYDRLSDLYREAYDRLHSGGAGAGWSGIHYALMNELRRYGKAPNSREEALRMLKQLLTDYETNVLGSQPQSDEEYLKKSTILNNKEKSNREIPDLIAVYFKGSSYMNVWTFSSQLTRRLLIWSVLSVLASTAIIFSSNPFLRGLGVQFFAWGVIDAGIAILGARASAKKKSKIQETERSESEAKESRWLERILWVNTGLDVLYIIGGVWLMQTWGAESSLWKGHGVGIIIQGGFLFFFDFFHAVSLRNIRSN